MTKSSVASYLASAIRETCWIGNGYSVSVMQREREREREGHKVTGKLVGKISSESGVVQMDDRSFI